MKPLDVKTLKEFLKLAGRNLSGEWVLIGGTVLPLLGIHVRVTVDIDLIGLSEEQQAQTLKLMEISESLGLPVETINSAGAYFLHKISGFRDHLVLLHQGENSTIYRPNLELFIGLKIKRLSGSDCEDCVNYIRYVKKNNEVYNKKSIIKKIESELSAADLTERKKRLVILRDAMKS